LRLEKGLLVLLDRGDGGKKILGPDDPEVANLLREASRAVTGQALQFDLQRAQPAADQKDVPSIVEKTKEMFEGDLL
jgi:hypothetical protein